jgi:putative nucleotidyltransferase with HDIG domain
MEKLPEIKQFVLIPDESKKWVTERLIQALSDDSLVPSFSEAALKLFALAQNEQTTMDDFTRVISFDPGLATRSIQVASSIAFAARPINNINQALMLIGIRQIQRIAFAVGAIDSFSRLSATVDWKRFWLHNILVARLTDKVAACFREPNGMEYLAGLLHDIGKLIIEHSFPQEFEQILSESAALGCSHAAIEHKLLGIDHTQIGAAICERLMIHGHLRRAIQFHHDPLSPRHAADRDGDGGFLAACISVADRLAHSAVAPAVPASQQTPPIQKSPAWTFLNRLATERPLEVDLESEFKKAESDLNAFLAK